MDYRDFVRPKFVDLLQALGLECEFKRALGSQLFYRNPKGDEVTVTDFLGGYGAALFGHNDPQFVEQLCTLLRNDVPFNAQMSIRGTAGALARALSEAFNRELKNNEQYISTFSNSGAEAVEIALFLIASERDGAGGVDPKNRCQRNVGHVLFSLPRMEPKAMTGHRLLPSGE